MFYLALLAHVNILGVTGGSVFVVNQSYRWTVTALLANRVLLDAVVFIRRQPTAIAVFPEDEVHSVVLGFNMDKGLDIESLTPHMVDEALGTGPSVNFG
jgi:hypothetical protein